MEMGREQIERVLSNGWAPLRDAEGFVEEATNHPDYRVCGLDVAVDGFGLVVTVEVTRGEGRASVAFRLGSARVGCRTATLAASARTLPDPLAEEVWAEVEERVAMVLSCQAMGVTSVQDAQEGGGEVFGVALGPGGRASMRRHDPAWEPVIKRGIDDVLDEISAQVSRRRPWLWWGWRCLVWALREMEGGDAHGRGEDGQAPARGAAGLRAAGEGGPGRGRDE